jgi:hypothetical protein
MDEDEEIVGNVAATLSSYCGRAAGEGQLQACAHDHTGDAIAIVRLVREGLPKEPPPR